MTRTSSTCKFDRNSAFTLRERSEPAGNIMVSLTDERPHNRALGITRNRREDAARSGMSAFTLIEMLVVLAVIGLVMMATLPRVGETVARGDEQRAFFETLLQEHLVFATEEGAPVTITGYKGTGNIVKHDGLRVKIPEVKGVDTVYINGERTEGLEYIITVYPDGLCDHFILEADGGNVFESIPLLMTVKRSKQ